MAVPVKNIKHIQIDLTWTDDYGQGTKNFYSVQALAQFLKDNPEFAKAVGYVPKSPQFNGKTK
jgi:hypothetical protein